MALYGAMMRKISIGSRHIYSWKNSYHVSIDPAVFSAIDRAIADRMHPHLHFTKVHAIIFHQINLTTAWHLMSLMITTITSLEINIEQIQDIDGGLLGMQIVLASMQTRCPSLNDFTVAYNQSNAMDELLPHFTHGLLGMQALTHLDISAFQNEGRFDSRRRRWHVGVKHTIFCLDTYVWLLLICHWKVLFYDAELMQDAFLCDWTLSHFKIQCWYMGHVLIYIA